MDWMPMVWPNIPTFSPNKLKKQPQAISTLPISFLSSPERQLLQLRADWVVFWEAFWGTCSDQRLNKQIKSRTRLFCSAFLHFLIYWSNEKKGV